MEMRNIRLKLSAGSTHHLVLEHPGGLHLRADISLAPWDRNKTTLLEG